MTEKDRTLTKLVLGKNADLSAELLRRYLQENGLNDSPIKVPLKRRTVGELQRAAEKLAGTGSTKRIAAND